MDQIDPGNIKESIKDAEYLKFNLYEKRSIINYIMSKPILL